MLQEDIEVFRQKLEADGYVVVPGIFASEVVNVVKKKLSDAILSVVEREAPEYFDPSIVVSERDVLLLLTRVKVNAPELAKQLRRRIISAVGYEIPNILKENDTLSFVVEKILGIRDFQLTLFLISICLPGSRDISEGLLGWHQDLGGAGKYTIWSPIFDHDSFHGGYLKFLPVDCGPLPHTVFSEDSNDVNTVSEALLPNGDPVSVSCRKGDVIIWHDLLPHMTGSNDSSISRYAFILWVDNAAKQTNSKQ